jgi:phosphoribosylformylglycinamidine (FGAM) synthase-like enzyme
MKRYRSIEVGKWYEVLEYHLTEEQKEILASKKAKDIKAKSELKKLIEENSKGEVDETKANELNDFYKSIKPQDRNFKLISCDLVEDTDIYSGILNFRINGEHKQIRF